MCVVASANRPTWPLLIDWTPLLSPHTAGGFQTLKERAVQIRKTNAYSYLSSRINVSCLLLVCQGPRNLFSVLNVTDDIRDSAAAPVRPSSTASHARNCGRVRWCTISFSSRLCRTDGQWRRRFACACWREKSQDKRRSLSALDIRRLLVVALLCPDSV